jgi:hypothetical protein
MHDDSVAVAGDDGSVRDWSIKTHCYLCGLPLDLNRPTNRDHVPPRRIFPKKIRSQVRGGLLTLRTHQTCQSAYARDEEYFFNTLLPNALGGPLGPALSEDFQHLIRRDQIAARLSETVRGQFEERPSGLVLPRGMVVQRVVGSRLNRTIWKIVRGLFAVECGALLPEGKARLLGISSPFDQEIPESFRPLIGRPTRGHTPRCFGYVFTDSITELPDWVRPALHLWVLYLWETYLIHAAFHDPTCACEKCLEPASPSTSD